MREIVRGRGEEAIRNNGTGVNKISQQQIKVPLRNVH